MKKPAENYQVVSVLTALGLFLAYVFLMCASLQHSFHVSAGSSDDAYVDGGAQ